MIMMMNHPHCVQISIAHAKWFLSYRRINKSLSQKLHFFVILLCLNSRSGDLGSPKLAHMTHSIIPMLSPNFSVLSFTIC